MKIQHGNQQKVLTGQGGIHVWVVNPAWYYFLNCFVTESGPGATLADSFPEKYTGHRMVEAQGKQSSQVCVWKIKPCHLCFAKAMELVGWILDLVLFSVSIIALEVNRNSLWTKYADIGKPGVMATMTGKHLYWAGRITFMFKQKAFYYSQMQNYACGNQIGD